MARFRLERNDAQNLRRDLPFLVPRERHTRSYCDNYNQQKRRRGFSQSVVHEIVFLPHVRQILFRLGGTNCYFSVRDTEIGRASGCFDDQSSGGNATRQNVGRGSENSRPISALPARTGPRNTT